MDTTHKRIRSVEKAKEDGGADSSGLDIISNLPTEILCHILSLLPTKYAVGTCILSTRWKDLFPLIPNLTLELDDTLSSSTSMTTFINFVNRLLNVTLRDVPSIYALHLSCRQFNNGQVIASWIRDTLRLNVKSLTLRTHRLINSDFLFDSLYGCNIVSLNLFLDFFDATPAFRFNLPNVTMLSVQYMRFNAVNVVLASCPSLKYLVVFNCACSISERLRICIPSLKALKLVSDIYSVQGDVEIDCPNLEYLFYDGFLARCCAIHKLKYLRGAHLDIDQAVFLYPFITDELVIELIRACSSVERLWFSDTFIRSLHRWARPLPNLPKLAMLMMHYMDASAWGIVPRFLDCAPNLRILFCKGGFDSGHYTRFKASLKKPWSIRSCKRNEMGHFFQIERKGGNTSIAG